MKIKRTWVVYPLIIMMLMLGAVPTYASSMPFSKHIIDDHFDGPRSVYAADVDGDGDIDVLGAAYEDNDIVWWENNESGSFTKHTIDYDFGGAHDVYAIDIDGDGDTDVLGAAWEDDDIAWWENVGGENFTKHIICDSFNEASSVCAADVNGDGDIDVIGAAYYADDVSWWENDGHENFTKHRIGWTGFFSVYPYDVYPTDIDSDGDMDIIATSVGYDEIRWWENVGGEEFTRHLITWDFYGACSVYAADMDADGDIDVLGAATDADDIAWWENDGHENFAKHIIDWNFDGARSVYATDIDGDGDIDVLGAATDADDIAWWENLDTPPAVTISVYYHAVGDNTITFTGTATDMQSNITSVEYRIDSSSWLPATASDGAFDEPSESYTFTTVPLADGAHTVYVRATDSTNNTTGEADYASVSFTLDTTPPTVIATSPAADATNVAVDTTPSVTFSEAMDSSTITTSSFTLDSVSGSVSYDSGTYTATFIPSANLDGNATYTATLTTAITDAAGNPLASAYSWSFTTESAVLESIGASPPSVSPTAVGAIQQLIITATYSDGSTADVTATSTYVSSDTTVATVSTGGLITGVAEGSATITVSYTEGGITKTTTVPVTVGVPGASATRTLPAWVDPGDDFNVTITASGCGAFGQVVETLPNGFSYVSCASTDVTVTEEDSTVKFTFIGDSVTFTYTVKASTTEGVYTFSGVVKDEYKIEYPVGGDEKVMVGFDPMDYDADSAGEISKAEAISAVVDYFDDTITKEQALEVIALYFTS